jgi:hypothetical protein
VSKPIKTEKKMVLPKKQSPEKVDTDAEEPSDKQKPEAEAETSVGDEKMSTKLSPKLPVVKKPLIGVKRPAVSGIKGIGGGLSDDLKKKLFS